MLVQVIHHYISHYAKEVSYVPEWKFFFQAWSRMCTTVTDFIPYHIGSPGHPQRHLGAHRLGLRDNPGIHNESLKPTFRIRVSLGQPNCTQLMPTISLLGYRIQIIFLYKQIIITHIIVINCIVIQHPNTPDHSPSFHLCSFSLEGYTIDKGLACRRVCQLLVWSFKCAFRPVHFSIQVQAASNNLELLKYQGRQSKK